MMEPENEYGKWWIISGSLESITAVLQNLVSVTSSTRDFFTGCFNCGSRAANCFKQRDASSNGAWFDCDQVHVDYPHCYENQVSFEFSSEPFSQYPITNINSNHVSRECNGILATTSPPDEEPHLFLNDDFEVKNEEEEEEKNEERFDEDGLEDSSRLVTKEDDVKEVSVSAKMNRNICKYKQSFVDPSSFVYKLEQDHFGYRNDFFRYEGEILSPKFRRSKSERNKQRTPMKSPVLGRTHSVTFSDFEFKDWDDDSLTSLEDNLSSVKFDEIWKPFELEGIFEVYNSSTLQSSTEYSSLKVKNPQTLFKSSNDKYEEIFPPLLSKLEKGRSEEGETQNDPRTETESEKNSSLVCDERLENESLIVENDNFLEVTQEELKEFIAACIVGDDVNNSQNAGIDNDNFDCDKILVYSGKSFNLKLIYDLVSEVKCQYLTFYSNSIRFKNDFPLPIITQNVMSAIEFDLNCRPFQLSLLEDIEKLRQKMLVFNNANNPPKVPEEILIESITSEEVRKESRLWQNIEKEEEELKEKVSRDIFDELLTKEVEAMAEIFNKKLLTYETNNCAQFIL